MVARTRGARTGAGERSGFKRSIVFCRAECDRHWGRRMVRLQRKHAPRLGYEVDPKPSKTGVLRNEANKSFVMNNSFRTPTQLRTDNWRIRDDWRHGLTAAGNQGPEGQDVEIGDTARQRRGPPIHCPCGSLTTESGKGSCQGGCPPAFGKPMSVTGLRLARRKQALLQRNFQGACRGGQSAGPFALVRKSARRDRWRFEYQRKNQCSQCVEWNQDFLQRW